MSVLPRLLVIFTLLGIWLPAHAQTIIGYPKGMLYATYDADGRRAVQIYQNHIKLIDLETLAVDSIAAMNALDFKWTYFPHFFNDKLFLTALGTGMVYHSNKDSILRLDKSFDHQMQVNSIEFTYRDTIYRHGGTGQWSARNQITFFDPNTREWQIERPYNSEKIPEGLFDHGYLLNGNNLYIFSGYQLNDHDPFQKIINEDLWVYEFPEHRWIYKGKTNPILREIKKKSIHTIYGNNKMTLYDHSNEVVEVDFEKNELKRFKLPRKPIMLPNINIFRSQIYKDQLFYYRPSYNDTLTNRFFPYYQFEFCSIPLKDIFVDQIDSTYAYEYELNYSYVWWSLISLGVVSLLFQGRSFLKKNNRISVRKHGLEFKGELFEIDKNSINLLKLLLSAKGEVSNNEVMQITYQNDLDYSNNVRIKNQLVDRTNLELKRILKIKNEVISVSKSDQDKRQKRFSIEKKYFNPL